MLAPTYFKDEQWELKLIFRAYLPLHSLSCCTGYVEHNFRGEAMLPRRNKELMQPVVWQGVTYEPWPIKAQALTKLARERCHVQKFRYRICRNCLCGSSGKRRSCWLPHIRKMTLARFLDAVNFKDGNPQQIQTNISRMKCGLSNRKL